MFLETCEKSIEAKRGEDDDARLLELRNRAEIDPMEQLKVWQVAAEKSFQYTQMTEMADASGY